jgi:hypothetical protein
VEPEEPFSREARLDETAQDDGGGFLVDLKRTIVRVASHLVLNSLQAARVFAAFSLGRRVLISNRPIHSNPTDGDRRC